MAHVTPDLAQLFGGLLHHHVATSAQPLPDARPGITWIWAAGGIYKRGVSSDLDILIPVAPAPSVPGLVDLLPHVRWAVCPSRLPGALLAPLLADARQSCVSAQGGRTILRPVERQYFYVWRDGTVRVVAPRDQATSATRIVYHMPHGVVLADIHSHHTMRAFFSMTDDRDDVGLSVSVVAGRIFDRPEIAVRLNVYGQRARVPALLVFDSLGPFADAYRGGSQCSS